MQRHLHKNFYLYFLKETASIFLLSVAVLTFLLILARLGKLTDFIINRGVSVWDILLLIFYSSPPYFTFTLPMAFLLSTIVVLGRFSADNEILALKANGVDLRSLFIPVAVFGLIISLVGLLNTHLLLPKSGQLFRDTFISVLKKGITIEDKEGIFNDSIPGVVIYVDKVDTNQRILSGIIVSDDRDKDVKQTITAERGTINLDSETLDLFFVLENGTVHRWEKESDTYRNVSFKHHTFAINFSGLPLYHRELRKKPYEMSREELARLLARSKEEARYEILLEVLRKVSLPLSALAFVLIAVPLGIRRKVGGRFSGMVYSLFLFVFYYLLLALTENMGKSLRLPIAITSFTPNIVIALIGIAISRNINGEAPVWFPGRLKAFFGRNLEKA
jgi:lipopolysaccharide export system permease protein